MAFLQQQQKFKKFVMNHFLEAFFVAPLFLNICIEVFGAWVNRKNISNLDIFKEDTAVFAKDGFLTQNLCYIENFHHQPSFIH